MNKNGIGRAIARPKEIENRETEKPVSSPDFSGRYPNLFAFLAEIRETEHWQKTGTITVIWEEGLYKVVLNDRPEKRSCFVSAVGLGEVFLIADRGLRAGSLKWRTKGYQTAHKR